MFRRFLFIGYFMLLQIGYAAVGPWQSDGPVTARLISTVQSIDSLDRIPLALELKLEKGWKTYWRVPGAAGAAPKLIPSDDWLADDVTWQLPAPDTYTLLGFQSYGYDSYVVLPFTVEKIKPNKNDTLSARVSVYACDNICLPLSMDLNLEFKGAADDIIDWSVTPLINEYLSQVPRQTELPNAVASRDDQGLYLEFSMLQPGVNPQLFVENLYVYEWPAPIIKQEGGIVRAWWNRPADKPMPDETDMLVFTYKDSLQAFSSQTQILSSARPVSQVTTTTSETETLWIIVLFAFIGGFILNAMPCVLPVLSVKLMSWIHWQGDRPEQVRAHAFVTGMGILTFFLIIALVLIGLQMTGAYVGWGIQFQSPWFLLVLLLIMLIFLANLLGYFEIQLPQMWQGKLFKIGHDRHGYVKSFLQGGTATLMATPCSAPFLGTAIAFAFTQSPGTLLLVFTAMGLGLASPYLVLFTFPQAIRALPKPGRWMNTVKKVLAAALAVTMIWLLLLIGQHIQIVGVVIASSLLLGWLALLQFAGKQRQSWGISFLVTAVLLGMVVFGTSRPSLRSTPGDLWQVYDQARVVEHLDMKRTVLIDVTAQWCLTCKYNELSVLETDEMLEFYQRHNVVLMQADWTKPDSKIEALLATYQRSAIPFNLVLGANASNGILLPELLTKGELKQAILDSQNSQASK